MTYTIFKVGKIQHYRMQVAGKRIQRTTRQRDKGIAQEIARKAHVDAVARANGGEPIPVLSELIGLWEAQQGPVASGAHRRSIDLFKRRHLYDLGALPIDALSTERVALARNAHLATRQHATVNHWLRVLKLLVLWAVRRKVIPALPWDVPMLSVQRRPRAILPVRLADQWFAAVDAATMRNPGVATATRLMFGLGLRELEAAGARWEWIDWERRTYTPGITKGREAVPVPLPRWLVERFEPQRRAAGLIAARPGGKEMKPGYARRAIRAANAACGIEGITPHRLRGSFATLLSEEGAPAKTVQTVMRHKDIKTTMGYVEVDLDTAARAQERIGAKINIGRKSGERLPARPQKR